MVRVRPSQSTPNLRAHPYEPAAMLASSRSAPYLLIDAPSRFPQSWIEATRMNAPTEYDPLEIVSTENLERELTLVRGAAAGSLAGVFGPRSITWQVDREA